MTFLPIVARELRVAARRRSTYWIRLTAALAALGIGGFIMLIPEFRTPRTLGAALFVGLSVVAFVYSLLAGIVTTADCVSQEKREGTLGLLFLTDLKGYDIVLGKLAATSWNAFYGMLAIFPVMAIPLLMGGVTGAEFWRVVLVCVNNLFFSLAIGMFSSAISRNERRALFLALGITLVFAVFLPLVGIFHSGWWRSGTPYPLFFIPSPSYACVLAFDQPFTSLKNFNFFYASVLCVHLMGWGLLFLCCRIVPRTWQDKAVSAKQARWRERWYRWGHGSPETRQAVRAKMLAVNPLYWLTGRDRLKSIFVWACLVMGGLLWTWGLLFYARDWRDETAYVWTALIAHTMLKWWLAYEVCARFGADRRSGALELLLSTPIAIRDILQGQLMALWRQFAGPAAVVLLADTLFLTAERTDKEMPLMWVAGMVMLVADLITLSWLGMWMSLSSRHTNRALGGTVVRILILPWGVFLMLLFLFSWRSHTWLSAFFRNETVVIFTWLAIGLLNNAAFGFRARHKLLRDFRIVATQRFERVTKFKVQNPKPKSEAAG